MLGGDFLKVKYAEFITVILALAVTLFNIGGLLMDLHLNKTTDLPQGSLVLSSVNEDRSVTVKFYAASLSGAKSAIRGEAVNKETGEIKHIYWALDESSAVVKWLSKNVLEVNGNVVNINGEPYDSRTQIELPEASLKNIIQKKA